MPIPMVLTSSDAYTAGLPYNRFKGLLLSGTVSIDNINSGVTGPLPPPGGVAVLQSTAAILTQLITTTAQPAKSAFIYIPQGSVGMTSSTNANIAAAPPYTGMGAAIYFDAVRFKLSVYSTVVGDWMSVTLSSS